MPLAHTATATGPNTEILLLGAGMLVLAAIFFFQKTASRQASLFLAVLGVAAVTGAFALGGSSGGGTSGEHASVSISSPEDGATVDASQPLALEVDLQGATLASDTTTDDGGHLHVYVDGETRGMPATLDVEVELEPGEHEIEVEYVDSEHQALDPPVTDSVEVVAE